MSNEKLEEPLAKRQKQSTNVSSISSEEEDLPFHSQLFQPANINQLASAHKDSKPYNHCIIDQLFDPAFLHKARKEIVQQLSFREKETDIYKINQTGDLSNLSGLPASELALLPTLHKLRDALYSKTFRKFIQNVTGCGPLSGIKTDMSCAEYSEGCYLLNHDDVIGTRRISFILYLVLDEPAWQPEWGGALELYPVLESDSNNPERPNVPVAKPSVSIPPAFNQFAFFKVQPGHSFHSVEEVVVVGDGEKGGKGARVSLSGWFHKPVEGEEGYEGEEGFAPKSSLQQLYATTLSPAIPYPTQLPLPLPLEPTASETELLTALLNPSYLSPKTLSHLRPQFVETSQLVLGEFLKKDVADELEALIRAKDAACEEGRRGVVVGGRVTNSVPKQDEGENVEAGWEIVGPPHIQRFLSYAPPSPSSTSTTPDRLSDLLSSISALLVSPAFRSLLASLTSLLPTAHTCHVRRFRPGLDYTLARGEPEGDEGEARLDVGLGLTPVPRDDGDKGLWESGEVGGWEMWLATEEGGDEATYGAKGGAEDGPLLAIEPGWNTLTLVLRDPGVLKFVKYVSARAPGSRWDIGGEWEVSQVEEEE
ncbi:hypothetical protein T439DRAFT_315803 [Meredithblackwellia eburnea MCA 4105]